MISKDGWLDRLDKRLGRFSDSDNTNGLRNRSWGATVLFWLCLPMVFLILSAGIAGLLSAIPMSNRIPKDVMAAYKSCVKNAKTKTECRPPVVTHNGRPASSLFGWPPWTGAGLLVLLGFAFAIIRREQDFQRFCKGAEILSAFVTQGKTAPQGVVDVFNGLASKLVGPVDASNQQTGSSAVAPPSTEEKEKVEKT